MTKSRLCKAACAVLAVAMLSSLCVFAACSDGDENVSSYVEVTAVTMSYERSEISVDGIAMDEGDKTTLVPKAETTGGEYDGRYDWSSSDPDVADFTTTGGVLEAKSAGKTEITVTARDTGVTSEPVEVNVYEPGSVFKVGVKDDVRGFGYRDPVYGTYSGFEIDLAYKIGEKLGYAEEDVVLLGVLPEDREEYLKSDVVDCVVATYTITDAREDEVNFSDPYYEDYVGALMSDAYASAITGTNDEVTLEDISKYLTREEMTEEDFAPCRVGYVKDSTAFDALENYMASSLDVVSDSEFGAVFEYAVYEDYDACEAAMKSGEIDLFVADHSILMSHLSSGKMTGDRFDTADYGVGTKKEEAVEGEETLTDRINTLIAEWLEDGTMADIIGGWIDEETGTLK